MFGLAFEFVRVMAARLAFEDDLIGHDIDRHAAFDDADVRRGLVIDAAKLHLRDALGGDFDRVDAFLGADPGMGFQAVDAKLHAVGRRRSGEQEADRVAVEHQAGARAQARDVQTFGADQPGLFANREDDVDGGAGQAILLYNPHDFADDRDAAFVVAAEHGGAVGAQDITVEDRYDAFAGDHRVHVSGKQQRLARRRVTGKLGDQIADVAADLRTGVIDGDRRAKFFQLPFKAHGDVIFAPRQAVDLDQLDEKIAYSLSIYHSELLASVAGIDWS